MNGLPFASVPPVIILCNHIIFMLPSQYIFYGFEGISHLLHAAAMITAGQCRAARGLLGWNQQQLAKAAGVGIVTVHQLENGLSQPRKATLEVIRRAFESAGVEFINGEGPGVRLRPVHKKKNR